MTKNENGVYLDYQTETLATRGRSSARVEIAQCDDGLYRFSISMDYSYGGFGGPIMDCSTGYGSYQSAKDAGIARLLERFPKAWESEPQSLHVELKEMREQIEALIRQPSLF